MDMRSRHSPFERYHPLYRPMPRTRERRCRRRSLGCSQDLETMAAGCYPVTCPGRYGRYGYPGSYPDTDTTREDIEVALPRRIRGVSNFNYRGGAVE